MLIYKSSYCASDRKQYLYLFMHWHTTMLEYLYAKHTSIWTIKCTDRKYRYIWSMWQAFRRHIHRTVVHKLFVWKIDAVNAVSAQTQHTDTNRYTHENQVKRVKKKTINDKKNTVKKLSKVHLHSYKSSTWKR